MVDAGQPASASWFSPDRIVVLPAPRVIDGQLRQPVEALAYDPADRVAPLIPAGGFLPLRRLAEALFLNGVTSPPRTAAKATRMSPLRALSVASFESSGTVAAPSFLDGGQHQMSWHRLYVEAVLPPGCGVQIDLAASDDPNFAPSEDDWHPHSLRRRPHRRGRLARAELARAGARCLAARPSEIPHHPGLLGADAAARTSAGLFTASSSARAAACAG